MKESLINLPINIMIADDHTIFRNGLAGLLSRNQSIKKIFQAENGIEALLIADTEPMDIILMDLEMPIMNGFEATRLIHKKHPDKKILILTIRDDQSSILETCSYGAKGYLFKNTNISELEQAIECIMSGGQYFQKEIAKIMVNGFTENPHVVFPFQLEDAIIGKEREVLFLICDGFTADEIGVKLALSKKTIEGIKGKLYLKTGTTNERSLISFSFRNRIVI